MNGPGDNWKRYLSLDEAHSAVYVDFEARMQGPQALLGVSWSGEGFSQYVVDSDLWPAGEAKAEGTCDRCWCINATLDSAVKIVTAFAELLNRRIVGFSRHELDVISELTPSVKEIWERHYRDGKRTLKKWARELHPEYQFQRIRGSGRYSLAQFMELGGYEVPRAYGPGKTGQRLASVRDQLRRKGSYRELTPTVKGKWAKLLMHNYHDVQGLRFLVEKACSELENVNDR